MRIRCTWGRTALDVQQPLATKLTLRAYNLSLEWPIQTQVIGSRSEVDSLDSLDVHPMHLGQNCIRCEHATTGYKANFESL